MKLPKVTYLRTMKSINRRSVCSTFVKGIKLLAAWRTTITCPRTVCPNCRLMVRLTEAVEEHRVVMTE